VEVLTGALNEQGISEVRCPACNEPLGASSFFPDRAVQRELSAIKVSCPHGCSWSNVYKEYPVHLQSCPLLPVSCPHSPCTAKSVRERLEEHLLVCPYRPVTCQYCTKMMHFKVLEIHEVEECDRRPVPCPLCSIQVPFNAVSLHQQEECTRATRPCPFAEFGCDVKGIGEEIVIHEKRDLHIHVRLLARGLKSAFQQLSSVGQHHTASLQRTEQHHIEVAITNIEERVTRLTSEFGNLLADFQKLKNDIQMKNRVTEETVTKVQHSTKELQDYYGELAMSMQTLQASGYGSVYVWKIPDFQRRRRDSVLGKTISLYSAPFYTSRHGYKFCMRVYLNGDGTGRGSHISLFICMMKGDFDPLLPWPFTQTITLCLVAQDPRARDIKQSFKADGESSSFKRPTSEMNTASGCPQFCPLSVLDNPAYLREDTLYLKASVNMKGIEHIT
jgi:hypothetical protein